MRREALEHARRAHEHERHARQRPGCTCSPCRRRGRRRPPRGRARRRASPLIESTSRSFPCAARDRADLGDRVEEPGRRLVVHDGDRLDVAALAAALDACEVGRRRPRRSRRPCAAAAPPRPSPRCARRRRRSTRRRAGPSATGTLVTAVSSAAVPEPVTSTAREPAARRERLGRRPRMRSSSACASGSRWQRSPRRAPPSRAARRSPARGSSRIMRRVRRYPSVTLWSNSGDEG